MIYRQKSQESYKLCLGLCSGSIELFYDISVQQLGDSLDVIEHHRWRFFGVLPLIHAVLDYPLFLNMIH